MSYGQWVIDEKETYKEFGYSSKDLTKGSKKPVKCYCESCGIKNNKKFREANRKHKCKPIIDGKKKCFKCKERKSIEEFSKNRSTFDGYQKLCKECFSNEKSVKYNYKKRSQLRKQNLKEYLKYKTSALKSKCKTKNVEFNLGDNFLYELYQEQKGKCYYSQLNIKHNKICSQFDSISVDRLDPNGGYTEDNVVLSAFLINSFKGKMNENEYKNILKVVLPKLDEYSKK